MTKKLRSGESCIAAVVRNHCKYHLEFLPCRSGQGGGSPGNRQGGHREAISHSILSMARDVARGLPKDAEPKFDSQLLHILKNQHNPTARHRCDAFG